MKRFVEYFILIVVGVFLGFVYINYSLNQESQALEKVGDYSEQFVNVEQDIIVLSTSWCTSCEKVRNLLQERGLDYVEYDVEKTEQGIRMIQDLKENVVPILIFRTLTIRGVPKVNRLSEIISENNLQDS